ncbi:MAG: hypothetical protein J6W82_07850 [Bacteroidales bacterium]|nr:hypothetical protein [Bacteroidales bacterium]
MKRLFNLLLTAAIALSALAVSCQMYDDSELRDKISGLEGRVSSIESKIATANSNIDGLKNIVASLDGKVYVTSVKEISDGYQITFSDGNTVTLKNGVSPVIGVKEKDGVYYWTLNGDWLLGSDGKMMPVTGPAGADGQPGADAVAPQLKIEDGFWYVSTDGGTTWTKLDKATGEDGDSFFAQVELDELHAYLTLADGTILTIPLCDVETLLTRIQSIVYVPDFDDGKITVNSAVIKYGNQAVLMDQPTEITYQVLPASLASILADNIWTWNRYMNPKADEFWEFCNIMYELNLPNLDKISGQAFRNFLKEYGIKDIFAWFDVRQVNTRAGGDDNTEKYSLRILDIVKADNNTGEITFKVMPVNIASESFAAAGLKPEVDVNNNNWAHYVYDYDKLQAYQNRTAFAVQLRLYQIQDFQIADHDKDNKPIYKDYENELASTYTGLYPNILEPIELLQGAFVPDPKGDLVSVDGLNKDQTLPYNVFRKDGTDAEPGYRIIIDGLTPAFIIGGKKVSAKEAYELGYMLPGYELKSDVVKKGAVDDAVMISTNSDDLVEVEMDPDASEAVRKAAVGGSVEAKYTLKTPFGTTQCIGSVTITDGDNGQGGQGGDPQAQDEAYDFLHVDNYTINVSMADFDANDGSIDWWTQCAPVYYYEPVDPTNPDAPRGSFRDALADYSMMPVNLQLLGFNVVDGKDNVLTEDEIAKAGLEVQFVYSDDTLGAQELPALNQYGGYLYYSDLWLDRTTFFYQTGGKAFIPIKGRLFRNTNEGKKELTTRFSKPKAYASNSSVKLDYSAYALVPWETFSDFSGEDIVINLNEHKYYRESLTQFICLMDNRPGGICYSVIDCGKWVTGNVSMADASQGIAPPEGNGYLEGVTSKEAYHITGELEFDLDGMTQKLSKDLKKKISIVYSSNGMDFFSEPGDGRDPYIQFDYTSEIIFYGAVEMPVHVELPNPWQENLATDFTVVIQGQ